MKGLAAVLPLGLVVAASALPGCGGACVAKDDKIVVDLISAADLNDTGSGPQHVRFQVWAVRDKGMFDGARPEALAESDGVSTFERQGLGTVFVTDSSWIKPNSSRQVVLRVPEDEQFTHVGVAVLFPEPRKVIGALDCDDRAGYKVEKPEHKLTFSLGRSTVEAGLPGADPKK
jgi:hypothetical protein